jgi:hypothetical protein
MLKPAYLYKEQLEKKFAEIMYNDDYFLYMGYAHGHELPKIEPKDNVYQWAIVSPERVTNVDEYGNITEPVEIPEKIIGWFAYQIQPETDTVLNFGLYSFDRGNPVIGLDVYRKMEELIFNHRRIEWRVIGGNPVVKYYDKFCEKYGGNKVTLHSVVKDQNGVYRDEHIYEILR